MCRPAGLALLCLLAALLACSKPAAAKPVKTLRGTATWYDVPAGSLPARRADPGELTAAQNSLPLGTRVRVASEATGKSVTVQITDRGLSRASRIDLCKEAAEQIGLVGKGEVRVKMEVLPDDAQNRKEAGSPGAAE